MRAGMFDPAFRGPEDFDLWVRIVKGGGRIAYHRRPLVHYRRHPNSLSANRLALCQGGLDVMQKLLQRSDLSEPERTKLLSHMAYLRAIMAWEEGITAVQRGNALEAIHKLQDANQVLRKPKLSALIVGLRIVPWVAIPAFRLRQRMLSRER